MPIQGEIDAGGLCGGFGGTGPTVIIAAGIVVADGERPEHVRLTVTVGIGGKADLTERSLAIQAIDRTAIGVHLPSDLRQRVTARCLGISMWFAIFKRLPKYPKNKKYRFSKKSQRSNPLTFSRRGDPIAVLFPEHSEPMLAGF